MLIIKKIKIKKNIGKIYNLFGNIAE